jgi:hypothetical protein
VLPTEQAAQPAQRCRECALDRPRDQLTDDAAQIELRIAQGALDRQIDLDHAVAVLEQAHRQVHRQLPDAGDILARPQGQLVKRELVARADPTFLEAIGNIETEFAAHDREAGESGRIAA